MHQPHRATHRLWAPRNALCPSGLTPAAARRRGATYAAVLGLSLVAMAMGAGALQAVRAQARASQATSDAASARSFCLAGIEWARGRIKADPDWRTNLGYGQWADRKPIGNTTIVPSRSGTFSLQVAADGPGGALNPPVLLTATGAYGKSVQKMCVRLQSTITPLSCLEPAVCVSGTARFTNCQVYPSGELMASDGAMMGDILWLSRIRPDVESATSIVWGRFDGDTSYVTSERDFPTGSVFKQYVTDGASVPIEALPVNGLVREVARVVLSPKSNPFSGNTNTQGIYVIDCKGQSVAVRQSRIVGSLVLLNAGSGTVIDGSVNWVPAVSNYPCLLVEGNLTIAAVSSALQEGSPNFTNFNPSETPYPFPSGGTDNDTSDSYPSTVSGLIYVSGSVGILNSPSVTNLIVAGDLTATNATLTVSANSAYLASPPPGFFTEDMSPESGTWRQVVN